MSEMGTDRLEPAAAVPGGLANSSRGEEGPRARRPTPPTAPKNAEPAADWQGPPHEVDSLA